MHSNKKLHKGKKGGEMKLLLDNNSSTVFAACECLLALVMTRACLGHCLIAVNNTMTIDQTLDQLRSFALLIYRDVQPRRQSSVCRCCLLHSTMKPAEGGKGEVPVAASVQQVSAGGRRESMAA